MTDVAISVRDVVRDYRRPRTSLTKPGSVVHALRGVSFDVARGQRFGIVGESGCGKSTLLRIIAGLDQPTSGSVQVGGVEISRLPERRLRFLRAQLQLVFQDPMGSLDPRMRVRDIIAEEVAGEQAHVGEHVEDGHSKPRREWMLDCFIVGRDGAGDIGRLAGRRGGRRFWVSARSYRAARWLPATAPAATSPSGRLRPP